MRNTKHNTVAFVLLLSILLIMCMVMYLYIMGIFTESKATVTTATDLSATTTLETTADRKSTVDGTWVRKKSDDFNFAVIKINTIDSERFSFTLSAQSGANQGEVSGTGLITGNTARFIPDEDEYKACELQFLFTETSVTIVDDAQDGCTGYYAGSGVSYDGEYEKDGSIQATSVLSVFKNAADRQTFESLVGDDLSLFDETAGGSVTLDDLDTLQADVTAFGVRGLYTISESIIMVTPTGGIAAAVINPETDTVQYYNTIPGFENSLPKTIDTWRENFNEKQVVYRSRP